MEYFQLFGIYPIYNFELKESPPYGCGGGETHRRNLIQKLEVSNAASLIKIAVERKLI